MPYKTLWQKPRLHEDSTLHRKVSWLELFFDLIFVVVISELVHILSLNPSREMVVNYLFLFIPTWWIWIGATYYNDRFETEGLESRLFTFLLILPVAGLAIFAHHMPSSSSLGYGLCYALARLLIVILWIRAWIHEKRFRPVGTILISGYSFSVLIFLCSLWAPLTIRFILWTIALMCDLVTPLFTLKKQAALPHFNLSKLTERLALFVLIVIGETLVEVIQGIARHHHFTFRTVSEGIMGIAISFALWWIYFDYIAKKSPKKQHKTIFLWNYLHLVLVMGIGAIGAALLNVLTSKHHIPTDNARFLMTLSSSISLIFIGLLEIVLEKENHESTDLKISVGIKFFSSLMILLLGFFGQQLHAFALLALIFTAFLIPMSHAAYVWLWREIDQREAKEDH